MLAVFDMDGPQAAATRRKLLDMAATEKMQVCFYHAPFPATGHIAKAGNGFELVPVQWSSAFTCRYQIGVGCRSQIQSAGTFGWG
mgnify:CR=1 FL=1